MIRNPLQQVKLSTANEEIAEVHLIEDISQMIQQAVGRKLKAFLTEPINEEILNQILPSLS